MRSDFVMVTDSVTDSVTDTAPGHGLRHVSVMDRVERGQ